MSKFFLLWESDVFISSIEYWVWFKLTISTKTNHQQKRKESKWPFIPNQERGCYIHGWSCDLLPHHVHIPLHMGHLRSLLISLNCVVRKTKWRFQNYFWRLPWSLLLVETEYTWSKCQIILIENYRSYLYIFEIFTENCIHRWRENYFSNLC